MIIWTLDLYVYIYIYIYVRMMIFWMMIDDFWYFGLDECSGVFRWSQLQKDHAPLCQGLFTACLLLFFQHQHTMSIEIIIYYNILHVSILNTHAYTYIMYIWYYLHIYIWYSIYIYIYLYNISHLIHLCRRFAWIDPIFRFQRQSAARDELDTPGILWDDVLSLGEQQRLQFCRRGNGAMDPVGPICWWLEWLDVGLGYDDCYNDDCYNIMIVIICLL